MKFIKVKHLALAIWTAIFLLLVGGSLASAEGTWCGLFSLVEVEDGLASKYGEVRVGVGRVSDDEMVHLFASVDRTTWTFVLYNSRMKGGCIMSGDTWVEVLQKTLIEGQQIKAPRLSFPSDFPEVLREQSRD